VINQLIRELLVLGAVPFAIALLLTPLVRNVFQRLHIVDHPDGLRKLHQKPIPRIGGIPIAISYVVTLLLLPSVHTSSPWRDDKRLIVGLIVAATTVFLTGLIDDLLGLRPWQKLAGQLVGAGIVCGTGVHIASLGGYPVAPWIGIPITLAWLAVCTNAFNLIDGLDGLAAGMGLFATLTMFAAALLNGNVSLAFATVPLAGSLLGFLRYNFNPASVFLGDSGSLLVGFLLGSYAVVWSQKSATLLSLAAPVMALTVPLLDVCLSIVRRWLRGHPIFGADRSHIHHKLLERGLTHRRVVLVLYGVAGLCATFSLVQSLARERLAILVFIVFCGGVWAGVQRLGYLEFHGFRRALAASSLRRSIRGEMAIEAVEDRISQASTLDGCWEAVRDASRQHGFSHIEAHLGGRHFSDESAASAPNSCWQLRVPLDEGSYVEVGRNLLSGPEPASMVPFVEMLRTTLLPRLINLRDRERAVRALELDTRVSHAVGLIPLAESLDRENEPQRDRVAR